MARPRLVLALAKVTDTCHRPWSHHWSTLIAAPCVVARSDSREEREYIAALSIRMGLQAFVTHERVPLGQLYVLRRGMVVRLWRFLGVNSVWGACFLPTLHAALHLQRHLNGLACALSS